MASISHRTLLLWKDRQDRRNLSVCGWIPAWRMRGEAELNGGLDVYQKNGESAHSLTITTMRC